MIEKYIFTISSVVTIKGRFVAEGAPGITMRSDELLITGVDGLDQATMSSFEIDGEEQLLSTLDAYQFSLALREEMKREFMSKHGLATDKELEAFLEENDEHYPSPPKLHLPTLMKGKKVKISGTLSKGHMTTVIYFTFIGPSKAEERRN